jgi:hypothetical protein
MSNATTASQPTYSTSNVAGSLPSVYFTGANDASTNANLLSNSASTVFNSTTWDMYAVFKPTSVQFETAIFWNDPTVAVVLICGSSSMPPTYSVHYAGWRLAPSDGACRGNEVQLYQVYSTGTTLGRRVNGIFDGSVAQTATYSWPSRSSNSELAFTRPSTGTWTNGNTSLCEIIVYNTVLSDANRSSVESYLKNKWYVGSGVQLGNPFYTIPPSSVLPFSPSSITGCILWLDGADSTTVSFSSGTTVSQWTDKSGLSNHALSSTTPSNVSAPTYVVSDMGIRLTAASNTGIRGNMNAIYSSNATVFVVGSYISNAATPVYGPRLFILGSNTSDTYFNGGLHIVSQGLNPSFTSATPVLTDYFSATTGGYNGNYQTAIPFTYSTPFIYSVTNAINGTSTISVNSFLNGATSTYSASTKVPSFNASYSSNYNRFSIGTGIYSASGPNSDAYNGYVYEVIVYSNVLTTTQRQQVEGYLSAKWGILLGTTHPYYKFSPTNQTA